MVFELRLGEARLQPKHTVPQCPASEITSATSDEERCTRGITVD